MVEEKERGGAAVSRGSITQFMNSHRGNGDMLRWITRFQLSVQRMQEACNQIPDLGAKRSLERHGEPCVVDTLEKAELRP